MFWGNLLIIIVSGCINYTNSGTETPLLSQVRTEGVLQNEQSDNADFRDCPKSSSVGDEQLPASKPNKKHTFKEYPIITYSGYSLMYNVDYKIPKWVRYELLASETDGPYSRKGKNFRQDLSLKVPQADSDDYRNSGWSRGHMAPAGDFKWSDEAMWETFFYVNCCPQDQSLNAGQWNTLEQKVRSWARRYGSLTVYTGPIVLDNAYGRIGYNKVVVPDAFFKAILAGGQAIAFVLYNHNNNESLNRCAMSVDDLEVLSGIDFFAELDDDFENQVEATYNLKHWAL